MERIPRRWRAAGGIVLFVLCCARALGAPEEERASREAYKRGSKAYAAKRGWPVQVRSGRSGSLRPVSVFSARWRVTLDRRRNSPRKRIPVPVHSSPQPRGEMCG